MVDLDPAHFPDAYVDRFEERPPTRRLEPDERHRIGARWLVVIAAVTAVLVALGVVAAVASLSSTDDDTATTEPAPLRRLLFTVAPAGTTLAHAAETPGAATRVRRSVAALAGPDAAVATVTAQLDDGSRWPPAGATDTLTLAGGDTAYVDTDLVWRRAGVRYRAQFGTGVPDRVVLTTLADGVRPTADATGTEPAAFTLTPPPGWRVTYTGADPDDVPTATAVYRGDGRTVQVTTWAIAGAVPLATARATGARSVSVGDRDTRATLWRDEDGPLVSSATAHLVWQEPDGVLVHVRSTGITDAELVAAAGTLVTATDARWDDALATRTPTT